MIDEFSLSLITGEPQRRSRPLFFTALPRFPHFFPHDLVFNMVAALSPHTTVYVAYRTPSLDFRWLDVARNERPRLNVAKSWRWNVSCVRRRGVFTAQSARQYANWRGMASLWGPGLWVTSRYDWGWQAQPIGRAGLIALANRMVSFPSVLLSYMFPVCWHSEAFPALLHGGRTGGIVGNFRSGG